MSNEVDTCRDRLAPYCIGYGLDLGFGGARPIVPHAICIDREIAHPARANFPGDNYPTHLVGNVAKLRWFMYGSMDFIFSSHVLEDFLDTKSVLIEWFQVLRPGGNMVLFLPDQPTYEKRCFEANVRPNPAHKHKDFGLEYMLRCLDEIRIGREHVIHSLFPVPGNQYSFDLVVRKPR